MNEFEELEAFLRRVPSIDNCMRGRTMHKGRKECGNWWIAFSIDINHPLAWNVVQELSAVLNYLSIRDRLPTVFKPMSAPSYLNGGPKDSLKWVIESTVADLTPKTCAEWLSGRLPQPVDDQNCWSNSSDNEVRNSGMEIKQTFGLARPAPPKPPDCEVEGKTHKWFNLDDVSSGCYNCQVVRPGQLWRKPKT